MTLDDRIKRPIFRHDVYDHGCIFSAMSGDLKKYNGVIFTNNPGGNYRKKPQGDVGVCRRSDRLCGTALQCIRRTREVGGTDEPLDRTGAITANGI